MGWYLQPVSVEGFHLARVECAQHMTGARQDARIHLAALPDVHSVIIMNDDHGVMDDVKRNWEVIRTKDDQVQVLSWPFNTREGADAYATALYGAFGYVVSVREWDGK